jgi:hypothetical protein
MPAHGVSWLHVRAKYAVNTSCAEAGRSCRVRNGVRGSECHGHQHTVIGSGCGCTLPSYCPRMSARAPLHRDQGVQCTHMLMAIAGAFVLDKSS